jgi:hypothetical protein
VAGPLADGAPVAPLARRVSCARRALILGMPPTGMPMLAGMPMPEAPMPEPVLRAPITKS